MSLPCVLTLAEVERDRARRDWYAMPNRIARECLMNAQAQQLPVVDVKEMFNWRWYLAGLDNYAEIFRDGDRACSRSAL